MARKKTTSQSKETSPPFDAASAPNYKEIMDAWLPEVAPTTRELVQVGEQMLEQWHNPKLRGKRGAERLYILANIWIEQGRAEGEARGEAWGLRSALETVLTQKFGALPDAAQAALNAASLDTL